MKLNFKIYKLKESSKQYNQLIKEGSKNEFIIVSEDSEMIGYYNAHQLDQNGIMVIGGLNIVECSLLVKKEDLSLDHDGLACTICELDIPKKNLTVDIIDDVKRLNN